MKRWLLLQWVFGGVASLSSLGARAQVQSPAYANLYWESTSPPTGFSGDWDIDVAAYARQQQNAGNQKSPALALMTRDLIDSYLKSFISSDWSSQLVFWGVDEPNFNIPAPAPPSCS
jgi:hypothetical protein